MRLLLIMCIGFSAGVFAGVYALPLWCMPVAAGLSLLSIPIVLKQKNKKYRLSMLATIPFVIGLLLCFAHVLLTIRPAEKLVGEEQVVTVCLTRDPSCYEDYAKAEVRILDGPGKGHKAYLYVYDESMHSMLAGDSLQVLCRYDAAGEKYGEAYDNNYANGIYYILKARESVAYVGTDDSPAYLPQKIKRTLLQIVDEVFPADTKAFTQSLLLGEKAELYADHALNYSMRRAGFMHIVAVSGMHIAYLIALIRLFFGKRRFTSILCIVMIWVFAAVTGNSPSVLRAALMQTVFLMAPFFGREPDPLTTLSLALAVLLSANPSSASSISLQLSFGAMAGILLITDKLTANENGGNILQKTWFYSRGVLAVSVGVTVFTLPLSAVHFGYFSLISPVTNFVAGWAVSLAFCGGYLAVAAGALYRPIGAALAKIASLFCRHIIGVAKTASAIPYITVNFEFPVFRLWLGFLFTLIGISLLTEWSIKKKVLIPTGLGCITLAAAMLLTVKSYKNGDTVFTALDVGQGQGITIMSGGAAAMIDCGGMNTLTNPGDRCGMYLQAAGHYKLDYLILTHLHKDHANGVLNLMEYVDIAKILMPENPDDSDGMLEEILEGCRFHGICVEYISEDKQIRLGQCSLMLFAPSETGNINERCISVLASANDIDMLITGDAPKSAERALVTGYDFSGTEIVVAGHHGSATSACGDLLQAAGGNTAIISCGYNTYGHPTHETLERLKAYGYNVYRTDLHGKIEIRIPKA